LAGALDHALANPHIAHQWALNARRQLGTRYAPETLAAVLEEVYSPSSVPAHVTQIWSEAS
jgi:hypothetical protein